MTYRSKIYLIVSVFLLAVTLNTYANPQGENVAAGGATFTMQGNYTTDIISGTMTATVSPYGQIKGEFHLMRACN